MMANTRKRGTKEIKQRSKKKETQKKKLWSFRSIARCLSNKKGNLKRDK